MKGGLLPVGGLLGQAFFLAALLAFSHGLLKWAALHGGDTLLETLVRYWYLVGAALGLYGFIFFYYLVVLKHYDLGPLYGVYTGLAVLLVLVMSVGVFRESMQPAQLVGCVFISVGVYLVGRT